MTKVRISVVQYLNTAPLVRGFTHGPLKGKYDLSFTVPSQCAEALRTGAADVAIIPAIEYQRIVSDGIGLTILPGLAIASKERVRSLLILSKVPIRQARRIALDSSSRSTQALVKILAAKRWQIAPDFVEAEPEPAAMLAEADAALVIGDVALRIAIAAEQRVSPGPDVEWLTSVSAVENALVAAQPHPEHGRANAASAERLREAPFVLPRVAPRGVQQLHIYDVVKEWWHLTEKPAVLAVWAARNQSFANNVVSAQLAADFLASRDFGLTQIPQIAAEAARDMQLPERELRLYLEKNIDYTLDPENFRGLQRFFQESQSLNLIGPLQPVSIAPTPHAVAQQRA